MILLPYVPFKCKNCQDWHIIGLTRWWKNFKEKYDYAMAHSNAGISNEVLKKRMEDKFFKK